METTETPVTDDNQPSPETSPAEVTDNVQMWQFSRFVHVGPDAEACDEGEDGSCANPLHFHAWIRLPNPFQQAHIREKALAAKARKARQLRDPDTDSSVILDEEMDRLRVIADETEEGKRALVDDLMQAVLYRDQVTAVRELGEDEEWATVGEDMERFRHLASLPDDDRDADEYGELERHLGKYDEAVREKMEAIQKPERDGLMSLSAEELVKRVRDQRVDAESNEDYMRVYSMWEWYIGTLKPVDLTAERPSVRVFDHIDRLQEAAPEVIEALEAAFTAIELAAGTKGALGNS